MFQLVYVSSAVAPLPKSELLKLLDKSRRNNTRDGLTGILLYKDGNFMQVLEGEEAAVRAVHARIANDPRHKGLITLLQGPIPDRRFPDWSMGLRDLHSPEVASIPGYNQFLNTPLTGQEFSGDPSRCERLLLIFKRTM